MATSYQPIYDITKTFEENLALGPNPKYKATLPAPKTKKTYKLLGYKLNSPFGSAAAPTGADSHFIKTMFGSGFDIVTTKTRRSVYYAPNPFPNIVHIIPGKILKNHNFKELKDRTTAKSSDYATLTIANSYGNNSLDPRYWVPDAQKANQAVGKGQLLITSVVGTIQDGFNSEAYYRDFAVVAKLAKDAGAQAIEINLSCPNVLNEGVLCYDPMAVGMVCEIVKQAVGDTPLIAKIGYFPPTEQELLEHVVAAAQPQVSAIAAINTFAAPVYDEKGRQALPGHGRLKAGLSGHAIKDLGLDMAGRLHAIRQANQYDYELISVGGVLTPKDFQDYRAAGADAVLSATGAIWNANLANQIKKILE